MDGLGRSGRMRGISGTRFVSPSWLPGGEQTTAPCTNGWLRALCWRTHARTRGACNLLGESTGTPCAPSVV